MREIPLDASWGVLALPLAFKVSPFVYLHMYVCTLVYRCVGFRSGALLNSSVILHGDTELSNSALPKVKSFVLNLI